jgi:hypothetical protein
MTPGSLPLSLYRGDSYSWRFVLWADAGKTIPADLAGVVAKAEIRDKYAGANITPLICAIEMPNAILVSMTAAVCARLPAKGVWDLQLTYPEGQVATVLAGAVTVAADVTDSSPTARAFTPAIVA